MAIKRATYKDRAVEDMEGRELRRKARMRKISIFLPEDTIRELTVKLPGLSQSTAARFIIEKYLQDN